MVTPKERLKNVLNRTATDRPPCICPGGMMNMVTKELMELVNVFLPEAHTDSILMTRLAKSVYDNGCFENVGVPFCMTVEAQSLGAEVDLGNSIYEPHVVNYVLDSAAAYTNLPPLNILGGRAQVVLEAIGMLKKEVVDVPIIGNLTGPVSLATSLMEPVTFYKEMRKKNKEVHEYMEFITDQLIVFGQAQIEAGADVIAISDPSGTGEILGPKYFAEFAACYLNKLLHGLKNDQVSTIVHICGKMNSVYQELNQVGSDILSFDAIVSLKEAREALGARIIMGNISSYALEFADPDRIQRLTRRCVEKGTDIIAPACGLGMKSPLSNVQTILKTLKNC